MSRKEDERIERVCADYLDEHFYPCFKGFERIHDARQFRGIDVIVTTSKGVKFNADEKVKYRDGMINQVIACPSFELSRLISTGERSAGWFLDQKSLTHYYVIISPFLREGNTPEKIVKGNIDHLVVLLVSPVKMWPWLLSHDMTPEKLAREAKAIEYGREYNRWPNVKDEWKVKLKRTDKLEEQPVNLVLHRIDILAEMGGKEFRVDSFGTRQIR